MTIMADLLQDPYSVMGFERGARVSRQAGAVVAHEVSRFGRNRRTGVRAAYAAIGSFRLPHSNEFGAAPCDSEISNMRNPALFGFSPASGHDSALKARA